MIPISFFSRDRLWSACVGDTRGLGGRWWETGAFQRGRTALCNLASGLQEGWWGAPTPTLPQPPSHLRPVTNKAGRSDFRNQRFEPDTGKMRKVPLALEKQGSEEIPPSKNPENAQKAENVDTKTRKMQKMRMTGFNVTGFR